MEINLVEGCRFLGRMPYFACKWISKTNCPPMIKRYFIICILLGNYISSFSQVDVSNQIKGTRLMLKLPKDFKEDSLLTGFVSDVDSSTIIIFEIENPYTFEELIRKRTQGSLFHIVDTNSIEEFRYDGYKAVQFEYYIPATKEWWYSINFGSDDFLVDISVCTSDQRLGGLKKVVKNGKYNKDLKIDEDYGRGFTVSLEKTNFRVFKKDVHTINTKEQDKFGTVISWLNMTRMPKSYFQGLPTTGAIDATYLLYNYNKKLIKTDSMTIDNQASQLVWSLYIEDHKTYQEYSIIGILPKTDFDLLIMGAVNSERKIDVLLNILKTIKFKAK